MARLTITLDDQLHQSLKEAAARQGRSIGKIIEEGLLLRGIKPMSTARSLVDQARARAQMPEREAIELAVLETRRHRAGR